MISKKTFCKVIEWVKEQDRIDSDFGKSLETVCDSWCIYGTKNKKYEALFLLLEEIFNDTNNWIGWWLYEDVEKEITYTNSKEKTPLKTPEQLYDFLTK